MELAMPQLCLYGLNLLTWLVSSLQHVIIGLLKRRAFIVHIGLIDFFSWHRRTKLIKQE